MDEKPIIKSVGELLSEIEKGIREKEAVEKERKKSFSRAERQKREVEYTKEKEAEKEEELVEDYLKKKFTKKDEEKEKAEIETRRKEAMERIRTEERRKKGLYYPFELAEMLHLPESVILDGIERGIYEGVQDPITNELLVRLKPEQKLS